MKKFISVFVFAMLSSSALAASDSKKIVECVLHDHGSFRLEKTDQAFQIHVFNAGGLGLAKALGLQDVGRYWRYSAAAVNFSSCQYSRSIDSSLVFECSADSVDLSMGWPSYEGTFEKITARGIKTNDGIAVSMYVQDSIRRLDVTDHFHFKDRDCQISEIVKEGSKSPGFSCDPKCIDGVPYCCIGSQCFKQQGKC